MRSTTLIAAAMALGCGQPAEKPFESPVPQDPGPDLGKMDGWTQADHTEVAPGVFLLNSIAEGGPQWAGQEERVGPEPDRLEASTTYSCSAYDSAVYYDTTRYGETFGGDVTWYGSVSASSYSSTWAGGSYRGDYVYVYASTTVPADVTVWTYGYVYINDNYVGYLQSTEGWGADWAWTSGYFSDSCSDDGDMSARVNLTHYGYQSSGWTDTETFYVSKTVRADVSCCP